MADRERLVQSTRWVIKVGTSLLTDTESGLNREAITALATQMAGLKKRGVEVVLVSSGSIVEGMRRMGWRSRPTELDQVQAAAAIGQMGMVQCYEATFNQFDILTAQVLLTHADLANRERYLNARNALRRLLQLDTIPVVNENDTIVNDDIRFGDNDTLAALVSNLVEAEVLVILTDQQGLFDADPRSSDSARLISVGQADDTGLLEFAGSAGHLGRGGMLTKVRAAQRAAHSGASTVIADGRQGDILLQLREGAEAGTLLLPGTGRIAARKQWLAGQLRGNGKLVLDDGAVSVLRDAGKSLLPIGVTAVEGSFRRGDIIICVDLAGREVGRGLVNYNSDEAARIAGQPSDRIKSILGYGGESELIHRDNMAVTG